MISSRGAGADAVATEIALPAQQQRRAVTSHPLPANTHAEAKLT